MFSVCALILIPLGYLFTWPLVDRLLGDRQDEPSPLQVALTALALSVGGLTLTLFWVGLLPGRWLNAPVALGIVLLGLGAGIVANRSWIVPANWGTYWRIQWRRLTRLDIESLLLWTLIGVGTVILINDLYYPFIGDDTLNRYGLQAKIIYTNQHIPDSVSGYPPLVPLSFVATWFAAGQINEHLARLLPAAVAAGTLGASYLAGREVLGQRAGLVAATVVGLTPMFISNSTLAYTDVPTTFPLTLAAFYVLCWWRGGKFRDSLLAGVLLGIAAFTKQSALTWAASFASIPLIWLVSTRRQAHLRRGMRTVKGWVGMILPALIIAGPWYVRNILLDGWPNIIPIAGWYHMLSPGTGWAGILPSLAWIRSFGPVPAVLYALGWVIGLIQAARQGWRALRGQETDLPADLIMATMVLPYWLAWWTNFSFDSRFLVLILPLMAIWAASPLERLIAWVTARAELRHWAWKPMGAVMLLGLLIWGSSDRLGGMYQALTQPFASDTERLLRAKGSMYDLVLYAQTHFDPDRDRIAIMDGRMAYYLYGYDIKVMYPKKLAGLDGYDYLIHTSSIYAVYGEGLPGWSQSEFYRHAFDPLIFEPVYESDGVHIMRILRTDIPTPDEYEAYKRAQQEAP